MLVAPSLHPTNYLLPTTTCTLCHYSLLPPHVIFAYYLLPFLYSFFLVSNPLTNYDVSLSLSFHISSTHTLHCFSSILQFLITYLFYCSFHWFVGSVLNFTRTAQWFLEGGSWKGISRQWLVWCLLTIICHPCINKTRRASWRWRLVSFTHAPYTLHARGIHTHCHFAFPAPSSLVGVAHIAYAAFLHFVVLASARKSALLYARTATTRTHIYYPQNYYALCIAYMHRMPVRLDNSDNSELDPPLHYTP